MAIMQPINAELINPGTGGMSGGRRLTHLTPTPPINATFDINPGTGGMSKFAAPPILLGKDHQHLA